MPKRPPVIGISPDLCTHLGRETVRVATTYADAVRRAGGCPVILCPPNPGGAEGSAMGTAGASDARELERAVGESLALCDGFVFTGGDDPRTEPFGVPTDPRVTLVYDRRQAFETALLHALAPGGADKPMLGVCLGMQMMALVRGGSIDQYLPDSLATHAEHWDREHRVEPAPGEASIRAGIVQSKHKQAVRDAGAMIVTATAPDGTIEAVRDPERRFAIGVQWHPERTREDALGDALFRALIHAAGGSD